MPCEHCGAVFVPKHPRARFCQTRCRLAAWNDQRRAKLETIETTLQRVVEQVQALRRMNKPRTQRSGCCSGP